MPVERTKNYKRVRVRPKAAFDRRSFRMVVSGTHRVVVGCPKGRYDVEEKRCRVPLQAQSILHPLKEPNPCFSCFMKGLGFAWPE